MFRPEGLAGMLHMARRRLAGLGGIARTAEE
jgi:hypothetical protein